MNERVPPLLISVALADPNTSCSPPENTLVWAATPPDNTRCAPPRLVVDPTVAA